MSRADTIAAPAWRAQVMRPDGSVRSEFLESTKPGNRPGFACQEWFREVHLEPGETAVYQIRQAGKLRFRTWGKRP
jgi:hypothetical protein